MEDYILQKETEMTAEILGEFIEKHKSRQIEYEKKQKLYESEHPILKAENKEAYKPDNRIVVNFAKYIVDTLNGFFIGIPIKINHDDPSVKEKLEFIEAYNNLDDEQAEIAKGCSINGHYFELLFTDEEAQIGITKLSPDQAFIIYDDSIRRRPLFGVRYYINVNDEMEGSFSDDEYIYYFRQGKDGLIFEDIEEHHFKEVPLVEFVENEEKQAAFESVETIMEAYNKALSEKANDVDYFADAYLAVLGAELDEDGVNKIRDNRIINLFGTDDASKIIVKFLEKPNADETQEHLIDRFEKLVFQISMIANINDENFGTSSGISLKYKLQSMVNLAKTKERKFTAALNQRYRMIARHPASGMQRDDWMKITYKFTQNVPNNLLEESEIAGNLAGITSKETQLEVLSNVTDVKAEQKRIETESKTQKEVINRTTYKGLSDEG